MDRGALPAARTATAEQVMPVRPDARLISYRPQSVLTDYGDRLDAVTFSIKDRPGKKNYYAADTVVCDTLLGLLSSAYTESPDLRVRVLFFPCYVGLSDDSFAGESTRLEIHTEFLGDHSLASGIRYLEVFSLTEDAFRYLTSQAAYSNARGNPFAEPVTVYSNIDNGHGYFIAANRIRIPIEE